MIQLSVIEFLTISQLITPNHLFELMLTEYNTPVSILINSYLYHHDVFVKHLSPAPSILIEVYLQQHH